MTHFHWLASSGAKKNHGDIHQSCLNCCGFHRIEKPIQISKPTTALSLCRFGDVNHWGGKYVHQRVSQISWAHGPSNWNSSRTHCSNFSQPENALISSRHVGLFENKVPQKLDCWSSWCVHFKTQPSLSQGSCCRARFSASQATCRSISKSSRELCAGAWASLHGELPKRASTSWRLGQRVSTLARKNGGQQNIGEKIPPSWPS